MRPLLFVDAIPPELHGWGAGLRIFSQELEKFLDAAANVVDVRVSVEKELPGLVSEHEVEHCGRKDWGDLVNQCLIPPIKAGVVEKCVVGGLYCASKICDPTEGDVNVFGLVDGSQLATDESRNSRRRNEVFLEQGYEA